MFPWQQLLKIEAGSYHVTKVRAHLPKLRDSKRGPLLRMAFGRYLASFQDLFSWGMESISVVTHENSLSFDLDLAATTLADLKTLVAERIEIPVEHQMLTFVGRTLDADEQTLSWYRIRRGSTLRLEDAREDEIRVVLERLAGGDPLSVEMSSQRSTIADLKHKVQEVEGIPVARLVIRNNDVGCTDNILLSRYKCNNVVNLQLEVRIDVHLTAYTGRAVDMNLSSHERVSALQGRVYRRLAISERYQQICYNDQVMLPDSRICQYGVVHGATIEVRLAMYETPVFLKTLTGETYLLTVTSFDTVQDVKRKVEANEGIPVARQRIVFMGVQLNNRDRFLSHRVECESAVHLLLRYGNSFEITCVVPNGRTRAIEVAPQEVVRFIKTRLFESDSVSTDIQQLYFRDQLLDNDDATMEECGIVSDSQLVLRIDQSRNTQIFVSLPGGGTISLWVDPMYTIARLKEKIALRREIPEDVQEIYFARVKLDNDRTLASYTIESNHMLHVEIANIPVLEISIKVPKNEVGDIEFQIPANQTVGTVKMSILNEKGFPVAHQQLFFDGVELENDKKLCDCDVTTGSSLTLILTSDDLTVQSPSMHLFVKTLTGKTITLETYSTSTVLELKQQIFEREGMEITSQCLILAGKEMEDYQTVGASGVQNQSVIHLVLRVPTHNSVHLVIEGTDAHWTNFDLDARLEDRVHDLKRRIEEREGVSGPVHQLQFNGRPLADELLLRDCDVIDGSTLLVIG